MTYIFSGILAGLVGTPLLTRLGAWRTSKQPLVCHPDSEILLLRTLMRRPGEAALVLDLEPGHFVDGGRESLWRELKDYCLAYITHTENTTREQTIANKDIVAQHGAESLLDRLTLAAMHTVSLIDEHTETLTEAEVVAHAQKIYSSGVDRTYYAGNAKVIKTNKVDAPLKREIPKPTFAQTITYFCILLTGTVVCLSVGALASDPVAVAMYSAGMLLLLAGSVVWTVVDLDTLYIDIPTLVVFGAGAWLCTVVGAMISGTLNHVVLGLGSTFVVGGFIFIVGLLHAKLRGVHGMGGGDYMLMPVVMGVPVAVTGVLYMANWILLTSLLLGVGGWLVKYLKVTGFNKSTPYAFGPYLACGWFITLGLWRITV